MNFYKLMIQFAYQAFDCLDISKMSTRGSTCVVTPHSNRVGKTQVKLPHGQYLKRLNRETREKKARCRQIERIKELKRQYTPHDGEKVVESKKTDYNIHSILTHLTDTAKGFGEVLPERIMREAEALIAVALAMRECASPTQFVSIMFLYVRDHVETSMMTAVCDYINDLLKQKVSPQSEEPLPKWITSLKTMQGNWHLFRNNHTWKHMQELMCIMVSIGLCKATDLEFSIAGFKMVEKEMLEKQKSGFDLVDAVISVVAFFAEGAYLCFKKGSLKPLLMSDSGACEVDDEYVEILKMWDLVHAGNLTKIMGKTEAEFVNRLETLTSRLKTMKESLHGFDKRLVMQKIERLALIINDYTTLKISSGIREAPFAVELYGDSGQGKTSLGDIIVSAMLAEMDYPQGLEYRAIINPDEKYQSTWFTNKTVAIFDDIANTKAQFSEGSPLRLLIDFCNNQTAVAAKADIQDKGKCFIEPKLVLATTNKKNLDAGVFSNCPYSIQRRMDVIITVRAKKQFQRLDTRGRPCGIDAEKVIASQTVDGVHLQPNIDDIWELTLEKAVCPNKITTVADYEPIVWKGKPMVDVSAQEAVEYCCEQFRKHSEHQRLLVERFATRKDRFVKCETCNKLTDFCKCGHLRLSDSESGTLQEAQQLLSTPEDASSTSDISEATQESYSLAEKRPGWVKMPKPLCDKCQGFEHPGEPCQERCADCCRDSNYCICRNEPHMGGLGWTMGHALYTVGCTARNVFFKEVKTVEKKTGEWLYDNGLKLYEAHHWVQLLPLDWFDSPMVQEYIREQIEHKAVFWIWFWIYFARIVCLVCAFACPIGTPLYLFMYFSFSRNFSEVVINMYLQKIRDIHGNIPRIVKKVRDGYGKNFVKYVIVGGGLVLLVKVLKAIWFYYQNGDKAPHGSLQPTTEEEVKQRDAETNQWVQVEYEPLPEEDGDCTSVSSLEAVVWKNLWYGAIEKDGREYFVNCLFIATGFYLLPQHYFFHHGEEFEIVFKKNLSGNSGTTFRATASLKTSVPLEGDMRLCYTPTGGSMKDLTFHFPEKHIDKCHFHMVWRQDTSERYLWKGRGDRRFTSNGFATFNGLDYRNLDNPTFEGMCGAVLMSVSKNTCIAGFHVGGVTNQPIGVATSYNRKEIQRAFEKIIQLETVMWTGRSAAMRLVQLGQKFLDGRMKAKIKSALNYMPHGSQVRYHGECIGATTYHSDVRRTPISEEVTKVCGVENIWGKPKFNPDWEGWQKCLSTLSTPARSFPPSLLQKAAVCYKGPLIDIIRKMPYWHRGPLSDKEALVGIPGQKFMDAIKLNTSIGYPMGGNKRKHVVELEPTEDFPCNREFTPEIMDEIREVEERFRNGDRAYCIAKACKKDEVLPVAKGKCRIFYGNTIALTFLIRKYFLPVLRFLQMNPLVSECAVGVNSHGPEWDQLHKFMIHHGTDQIFAGDYSKYDQRMPSQMVSAALRICIDLAKEMGYSDDDLMLMHTMSGELVFPYIAYDGSLISLTEGTHISGNSLTVVLNSIVGSLNLRCFYYTQYPQDEVGSFRKYVNIITYGDDNKGSVSRERPLFNIKECSKFLGSYGQIYTMPDKESELTEYMLDEDAEFLKRRSVYHEALGCYVGALDESSIFKSLHCYLRPKGAPLTPHEACAQNIDGAIREWFNHGKEVFDKRRAQMTQIAKTCDIDFMCTMLNMTYEEMCQEWHEKYTQPEESGC